MIVDLQISKVVTKWIIFTGSTIYHYKQTISMRHFLDLLHEIYYFLLE